MNEKSVLKETVVKQENLVSKELIRVKIPSRRDKADVSCIGPSSEQIDSFNRP